MREPRLFAGRGVSSRIGPNGHSVKDLAARLRYSGAAMRILVVEDDNKIASFVVKGLKQAGFAVDRCADGEEALVLAETTSYDAAVVDVMLPKLDGLSLIQRLRSQKIQVPVIILSAKASVDDRVRGLQAGGDDYLTKPFAFSELTARLQALIRRATHTAEPTRLAVGDLVLDLLTREVTRAGQKVELQSREFALLEYCHAPRGANGDQNDDFGAHLRLQFRSPNQCRRRAGPSAAGENRPGQNAPAHHSRSRICPSSRISCCAVLPSA